MADLRTPDPTLLDVYDEHVMLMPETDDARYPLEVAHRAVNQADDKALCGFTFPGLPTWLPGRSAAYIAVPCRDCFPDAPRPGCRFGVNPHSGKVSPTNQPDPHLAWQVPDTEGVGR